MFSLQSVSTDTQALPLTSLHMLTTSALSSMTALKLQVMHPLPTCHLSWATLTCCPVASVGVIVAPLLDFHDSCFDLDVLSIHTSPLIRMMHFLVPWWECPLPLPFNLIPYGCSLSPCSASHLYH